MCREERAFIQNVDLAPERCKWCSCPALTKLAGERESIQRAGIAYLSEGPTQHKGERKVSFRDRCEQARKGGMAHGPGPDLCSSNMMKSMNQKSEKHKRSQGSTCPGLWLGT